MDLLAPLSILGGGIASYFGAKETNEANAAMANQQMEFQERMSSTAYQRAMKDMRDAGLNPMLASTQGGASTPAGSMATMQNPLADAQSSARALAQYNLDKDQQVASINKINSDIDVNKENKLLIQKQAEQADNSAKKLARETRAIDTDVNFKNAQTGLTSQQMRNAQATLKQISEQIKSTQLDNSATSAQLPYLRANEQRKSDNSGLLFWKDILTDVLGSATGAAKNVQEIRYMKPKGK